LCIGGVGGAERRRRRGKNPRANKHEGAGPLSAVFI
jgi:hypothetical protein